MDIINKQKKKVTAAAFSVISNTTLVIFKLIIGIIIGSVSVISEAIHSGVDLLASIIALSAVKTSNKPADKSHSYGHGKIENIAGTMEALLIFLAAAWIIYEAIHKLFKSQPMDAVGWGIVVMLFSAVANFLVSRNLFKVGKETDSIALEADAWHLRTDVYTSLGVMSGLVLYRLGESIFPGIDLSWIDPAAAIVVALLIIKAAFELTSESIRDLMDASLPPDEEALIEKYIEDFKDHVYSFHNLKTRKSGPYRFYDFHLVVDPSMSVQASHDLGDSIVEKIKNHFPEAKITIHTEPCDKSCPPNCVPNCFLLIPDIDS